MSYRLDPHEPLEAEIRKAARSFLASAASGLGAVPGAAEPGLGVHAARKSLKRFRSLLRLLRPQIGDRAYERGAEVARELGRRLGEPRDADVMARTAQALVHGIVPPITGAAVDRIAEDMAHERDALMDALRADGAVFAEARSSLTVLEHRVQGWRLSGLGWGSLMDGVQRSYRRGRRSFGVSAERRDPEALHRTRRRTKDLRYQLELVLAAWPPVLEGEARAAERLEALLGELRDLDVLRACLIAGRGDWDPAVVDLLVDAADGRFATIRDGVQRIGSLVYADEPGAVRRRLRVIAAEGIRPRPIA